MDKEQIAALLTDIRGLLRENVQGAEISSSTADVLYDALESIVEHHNSACVRNQSPSDFLIDS